MKNAIFFLTFFVITISKGQNINLGDNGSGFILKIDTSTLKTEDKDKEIYSITIVGMMDTSTMELTRLKLAVNYKDDQLKQASKAELMYYVDCAKQKIALCKTTYSDSSGTALHSISYCEYGKTYEKVKSGTMRKQIAGYVCNAPKH